MRDRTALVHLASGIGNIVIATPLLRVMHSHGWQIDLVVEGDYPDTAALFAGWDTVRTVYDGGLAELLAQPYDKIVPAVPPFYWDRYAALFKDRRNCVPRPPPPLFYGNERDFYLFFARSLGCDTRQAPPSFLPIGAATDQGIGRGTLVLAPGCKPLEMAAKRWPHFSELAECFDDVAVVGTEGDLIRFDGSPTIFPAHVRSFVGRATLRETAALLAAAGAVVANDSGLGHLASAVGAPTLMLFGPTPERVLGALPPNTRPLRRGLPCEPCWFSRRFVACGSRIDCLGSLSVDKVAEMARGLLAG